MHVIWRIALIILLGTLCACGVRIQGIEIGRVFDAAGKVPDMLTKDEQSEVEIGEDTARSLLQKHTIAHNEALQRYVNTVGYWLAKHTSRPHLPWHFIVIDDPSFNAFAAPGGYIFVTTGLLGSLGSESELANVLAHEMAHVLYRHHLVALEAKSKRGFAADLAILAAQTYRAKQQSGDQKTVDGPDGISAFDKVVRELYDKGLEREDELHADRIAVMLSSRAGYDPYAFLVTLQKIHSNEAVERNEFLQFIKQHPKADERLESLETTMFLLDGFTLSSRTLAERYQQRVFSKR